MSTLTVTLPVEVLIKDGIRHPHQKCFILTRSLVDYIMMELQDNEEFWKQYHIEENIPNANIFVLEHYVRIWEKDAWEKELEDRKNQAALKSTLSPTTSVISPTPKKKKNKALKNAMEQDAVFQAMLKAMFK